jgi:DNA-binding NtrC family response regulator
MTSHILLVEDDSALRVEILDYLLRRQHRVTACSTIEEAREFLARVSEDAVPLNTVVSDIRLPDGDGVSLYAENAPRLPGVKWILMSGNHDLVRLGNELKGQAGLPGCAIVDKPMPLRLLARFLSEGRPAA